LVGGGGGSEESEGEKGSEGGFHGWFGMRCLLLDNNNVVAPLLFIEARGFTFMFIYSEFPSRGRAHREG
jgi:uncharacterized membrane protein YhdT